MYIGYCGNVHPGQTIAEIKSNVTRYSLDVKSQVQPDEPMGIGLWLSATAAQELDVQSRLFEFRDWLAELDLVPFTLNGFPYGDFHQAVVKHDVYRPNWADAERLDYTIRLAEILNTLLPNGVDGTISTLPLGWPVIAGKSNIDNELFWKSCERNLKICAQRLDNIAQTSGRNICLCIEPEPGCVLDTWDDIVRFFDQHLLDDPASEFIREFVGVCHDVCHSAVMFEDQSEAIDQYHRAGIRIGKVQLSSAIDVDFETGTEEQQQLKLRQLGGFAEPKYLHQTSIRVGNETSFHEDLLLALNAAGNHPVGRWRVHFHVPIFAQSLELIGTTQSDIQNCLAAIKRTGEPMPHFEVETYAWNVLPQRHRFDSLSDGIAKEVAWFGELLKSE